MTFDPRRPIVMATFKTVLGHNLPVGTPLTIVEEPTASGEIDEAMARRLFASGNAVYREDARPTPVETPEAEKARLAAEALRDAVGTEGEGQLTPQEDLVTWQVDDAELKAKAGDRVTNDHLRAIAGRENVVVEGDDNKADLQRKIMEGRALRGAENSTYSGTAQGLTAGGTVLPGSTGAGTGQGADKGAVGDAHGPAGEGVSDGGE